MTYTDVQGGLAGLGNINSDPDFEDAAGGDYRLTSNSPCIDRGFGDDLVNIYIDSFDLNQEGDLSEPTPDLDLDCRVVDDPNVTNRGVGDA